jgi:hypothetical protein
MCGGAPGVLVQEPDAVPSPVGEDDNGTVPQLQPPGPLGSVPVQ